MKKHMIDCNTVMECDCIPSPKTIVTVGTPIPAPPNAAGHVS